MYTTNKDELDSNVNIHVGCMMTAILACVCRKLNL